MAGLHFRCSFFPKKEIYTTFAPLFHITGTQSLLCSFFCLLTCLDSRLRKTLISTLTQITLGKIRVLKEVGSDEVLPHFEYPRTLFYASLLSSLVVFALYPLLSNFSLTRSTYYNVQLKWLSEIQGTDLEKQLSDISLSRSSSNVDAFVDTFPPTAKLNVVLQGPMDKYVLLLPPSPSPPSRK